MKMRNNDDDDDASRCAFQEEFAAQTPTIETPTKKTQPAQLLLDWLLQHWTKPTICTRDIRAYGPNSIRDEKTTIDSAETLAKHGWLIPLKAHRHDRRVWQIVQKPLIHPIIPTE
jgi:hypothetical protein